MTNDEEPIELLMPSAAMQPVLSDLRAALVRLGDVKTRSAPRVWDNIDFEGTAANIARFTLWTEGWDEGVIPAGDVNAASDVGHRLSTELEIMSPDDLEERFRVIVDGAPVTRLYRRISDAQTVSRLMKDTMALGWSGFDMLALSPAEQETMRRRRMFVDAFRNDFDWTRLRALELSQSAASRARRSRAARAGPHSPVRFCAHAPSAASGTGRSAPEAGSRRTRRGSRLSSRAPGSPPGRASRRRAQPGRMPS